MTWADIKAKWGDKDPYDMEDDELREYKNDCFLAYETEGFSKKFHSPYDDEGYAHNGKPFKVMRRAKESEADLEAMPLWAVKFEGERKYYFCYPEEICVGEEENYGHYGEV